MARKSEVAPAPATERVFAPEPVAPALQPRQMRVERQGAKSEPITRRFPQVRGGICEWCGVLDPRVPSQFQYQMCPHYRGKQLMCTYCPETKNPDEVIAHANMSIAESPTDPNTLVVWCDSFECSKKHLERFKRNA